MTMDAKFKERLTLINKAIRCEPVDRIPLIWQGTAPAPIQMGLTMAEFAFEPLKGIKAQLDYMDKLGVDGSNAPLWFRADVGLTATWLSHIKMPGRELPANMIWQVEEKKTCPSRIMTSSSTRGLRPSWVSCSHGWWICSNSRRVQGKWTVHAGHVPADHRAGISGRGGRYVDHPV